MLSLRSRVKPPSSDDELQLTSTSRADSKGAASKKRKASSGRSSLTLVDDRPRKKVKEEFSDSDELPPSKISTRNTIIIRPVASRGLREGARNRFLLRHRDSFSPLLPSNSKFFENLRKDLLSHKDEKDLYSPREELDRQPDLIQGGLMRDYQLVGLSFMAYMYRNGMSCLLGDEMGTGKTLQTLSLFAHIRETSGATDPHLVICPLSVLSSWMGEAAHWLPSFKTIRFHGQQSERSRLKEELRREKFDILVTTYEAYVSEDAWFKSKRWTYCVLDEGHRVKNHETNMAHRLQGIGSQYRLILTGTPIHNHLVELWSLLHWLYPTVFTAATERAFKEAYDLSRGKYDPKFVTSCQRLLEVVMLRRTKASVESSVPPREEMLVFCPLSSMQRFWYMRLLTRMDTLTLQELFPIKAEDSNNTKAEMQQQIARAMSQTKANTQWKSLMNLLIQLRQLCNHPYLLKGAEPEPYEIGEHIVLSSSKFVLLDKLLGDLLPKHRVLIFSQWTGTLDLLEDFLELRGIPYARLDGSVARARRTWDIRLFQQKKSPYQVFLLSTRAGGLGINLTTATRVIMMDSDWNPQMDLQAIARAHRIGQKEIVKVYRLVVQDSVEDQMLSRLRKKLYLSLKVMGGDGSNDSGSGNLGTEDLLNILRGGTDALSRWDSDRGGMENFLHASISEILAKSHKQEGVRDVKLKREVEGPDAHPDLEAVEEEERLLLSGVEQVKSRLFEGRLIEKAKPQLPPSMKKADAVIVAEWNELVKRAHTNRLVVIDGIEYSSETMGLSAPAKAGPSRLTEKEKREPFEHEQWCIWCRDGGELITCRTCPRVWHETCSDTETEKTNLQPRCPQHACADCGRGTADAGGLLFKCQTCPNSFCEDCLPEGEVHTIGEVLPEFVLLGYGRDRCTGSYFIRCRECEDYFSQNPSAEESWLQEVEDVQKQLALQEL